MEPPWSGFCCPKGKQAQSWKEICPGAGALPVLAGGHIPSGWSDCRTPTLQWGWMGKQPASCSRDLSRGSCVCPRPGWGGILSGSGIVVPGLGSSTGITSDPPGPQWSPLHCPEPHFPHLPSACHAALPSGALVRSGWRTCSPSWRTPFPCWVSLPVLSLP